MPINATIERVDRFAAPADRRCRYAMEPRTSVRIALRQLKAAGIASPTLHAWVAKFDNAAVGDREEDEAALAHAH
jgi:hypothetical protein